MKVVLFFILSALLLGCASKLPEPDNSVGQFIVPVFSVNETSDPSYGFQYKMRIENSETKERTFISVVPETGLKLIVKKNMAPGNYCFKGYFAEPIVERKDLNFIFAPNFRPFSNCFDIIENQITIWRNKVDVRKVMDDQDFVQHRYFKPQSEDNKNQVLLKLKAYENFEKWTLGFSG